jgi:hypothetical protein
LAHSAISGSIQNEGALRSSIAATRPPTQATMTGNASTCGRANKCPATNATAVAMNASDAPSVRCRLRKRTNRANVSAIEVAASTTRPVHPAIEWETANMTCASHCVEIHGWPCMVNEYISVCGTVLWSRIH